MWIYPSVHSEGQSHRRFPGNLLVGHTVYAWGFQPSWTEHITWTEIQAQVTSDEIMVTQVCLQQTAFASG